MSVLGKEQKKPKGKRKEKKGMRDGKYYEWNSFFKMKKKKKTRQSKKKKLKRIFILFLKRKAQSYVEKFLSKKKKR